MNVLSTLSRHAPNLYIGEQFYIKVSFHHSCCAAQHGSVLCVNAQRYWWKQKFVLHCAVLHNFAQEEKNFFCFILVYLTSGHLGTIFVTVPNYIQFFWGGGGKLPRFPSSVRS